MDRHKRYYAADPDKHKKRSAEWKRNNRDRVRANDAAWRAANPERWALTRGKAALNHRCKKYGITSDEYHAMLSNQRKACAICRGDSPGTNHDWHIDHDHDTGKVRGLLCHHCNTALGHARDNPAILRAMIDYLNRSAEWNGR
jgi:Recombination endonuclease VII